MLKKIPYIQGLVWGTILFVLPLPLIQTLAIGVPTIYQSESFAFQLGSVAYVWFLVAIYLSTRPKWLDRLIGLPSIYMIHGILSLVAILLAYLHKSLSSSNGLIKLTGDWAFNIFIAIMLYSLVFMAGWLTTRLPIINKIKKWLEKVFKHEISVWLHRVNLIAVILVFIHVQLISYITAIKPYITLFDIYSLVFATVYLYAKFKNSRLLPKAKLIDKHELAKNFYEFTIRFPRSQKINVQAGDFVFINAPDNKALHELHPFSVLDFQTETRTLKLAIRGDGDFTREIQQLPLGAWIQVDGSYGRFTTFIHDHGSKDLVLVAGGSGIVPMISIITSYPDRPITLYYSAHRQADLVYANDLQQYAAAHPKLTLHIQTGRFNSDVEAKQLPQKQTIYLLSGPNQLGHAWQQSLKRNNILPNDIYYEEFSW